MKTLCLIIILCFFLFASGCDKNNDVTNTTGGSTTEKSYSGTANVTIKYYEYNALTGQDDFVEEKNYQYDTKIFVKQPLSTGSTTETNPVNIQIYPDRTSSSGEEGHLDISSAALFTVNNTNDLLLQYWSISINGNTINGTLADTHTAEAAAANLLWAWDDVAGIHMTMPFPIAVNTTMQGTITDSNLQITVQGESINTYRKFTATITAIRD